MTIRERRLIERIRYLRSCTRTVVILEQLQLYSGKAGKKKIPFATGTLLFSPSSDLFLYMLSWECSDSSASLPTCCGAYGPVVYTGYLEEGLVSSTDEASMLIVCSVSHRMSTTIYCRRKLRRGNDRLRIPRRSRENCYSWLSVEDAL